MHESSDGNRFGPTFKSASINLTPAQRKRWTSTTLSAVDVKEWKHPAMVPDENCLHLDTG